MKRLDWKTRHAAWLSGLAFLTAAAADAAVIAEFDVATSFVITGTLLGSSGSGSGLGTAVLEDTGVLTLITESTAVTGFTNSTQTTTTEILGTLVLDLAEPLARLSGTSGSNTVDDCVNNGAAVNACGFIAIGVANPFETLDDPIALDLTLGDVSTFLTTDIGSIATVATTYTLTTVPEPATAPLLGLGILGVAAARRARAR